MRRDPCRAEARHATIALMKHPLARPKWALPESSTLSAITREELYARILANVEQLDGDWAAVVNARTLDILGSEDAQAVARAVFLRFTESEGRKLYAGCDIAAAEFPHLYVLRSASATGETAAREFPAGVLGDGDNAFQVAADVTGSVLLVRGIADVDRLMTEGVPPGTIGVVHDAGGTMTAPILPEFDAILCLAGTVRSHLAIIAREFEVPVLMDVQLARPLVDGERITVHVSAKAQNVDAYFGDEFEPRAPITPAGGAGVATGDAA